MSVIHVDLKLWGVRRIREAIPDATVTGQAPAAVSGSTVWVEADGGITVAGIFKSALLRVNCYAPTRDEAHDLARLVEAVLRPDGDPVVSVQTQTGPNDVPDEGATYSRFYSLFAVTARGKEYL